MAKQQGETILIDQGNTFHVRIYYRRNNSWQGSIRWLEKEQTVFFRSLLEMTLLMFKAASPCIPDCTHSMSAGDRNYDFPLILQRSEE